MMKQKKVPGQFEVVPRLERAAPGVGTARLQITAAVSTGGGASEFDLCKLGGGLYVCTNDGGGAYWFWPPTSATRRRP